MGRRQKSWSWSRKFMSTRRAERVYSNKITEERRKLRAAKRACVFVLWVDIRVGCGLCVGEPYTLGIYERGIEK